ncbi:DUF4124 domain-containing protein [Deefgea sp. CFH1-16]|uniref:DUF4124 domain-containing protein n=1 Tax=Deefgea sp. CFH1-16 TaxID=2675457 RepID=UPI0015F6C692|nr:DUF4124 domain-containing protein [Deefgea sp. CFH1-16]MBM5575566.1 DUF4124 domain-containing protein [Deefgea sp. CFH1-16]
MRGLILLLCVLSVGAQAEVYKWKDDSGKVVYSDQPPPAAKAKAQPLGFKETIIITEVPKTAVASSTVAVKASAPTAVSSPAPVKPAKDEQACAAAEKRLAFLKGAKLFKQVSNQNGDMEYLPYKQKEQEIAEKTVFIEKNCR